MTDLPPDAPPANGNDEVDTLLAAFERRGREAEGLDLPQQQENTRTWVTIVIVSVFSAAVVVFALAAAIIAIWGDTERLEPMGSIIQILFGVISPIVTFILGYYFATRPQN